MTNVITSRFKNIQIENKKMIMKNVKLFEATWDIILLRYYLMMAIVFIAGFSGYWVLSVLAFPVFLSCIMGAKISFTTKKETHKEKSIKGEKLGQIYPA